MQREHRISLTAYNHLLELQGGVCAICKQPPQLHEGRLVIDHDHATGSFRGLLCRRCNLLLGYMRDNLAIAEAAILYLLHRGTTLEASVGFCSEEPLVEAYVEIPRA